MPFRMKNPNFVILTGSQTLRRILLFQPLTLHKKILGVSPLKTADTPGVDSFSGCMNAQRVIVKVLTRKKNFWAIQGKKYFFQKVAIPGSFLKTAASILQVLVRVTRPPIRG